MAFTIVSPLRVAQSKSKDFILNMNVYRNTHYRTLHSTKKTYEEAMSNRCAPLPCMDKVSVTYVVYPQTKRKCDLMNVVSIHSKYFLDTLVKLGKLPDDSYEHVIKESTCFGGVDRDNPRVEIIIEDLSWL